MRREVIMRQPNRSIWRPLLAALLFSTALLSPNRSAVAQAIQAQKPAEAPRISRPMRAPYIGDLSIFENPKRAENLQINRVMDLLAIKEGSVVADIGAGSGWFTVRAATRVGNNGTVYAVEINPDFLRYIEERAADQKLSNIRTVLGKEDDPL